MTEYDLFDQYHMDKPYTGGLYAVDISHHDINQCSYDYDNCMNLIIHDLHLNEILSDLFYMISVERWSLNEQSTLPLENKCGESNFIHIPSILP
jgi:hypothetical protein